MGLPAGERGEEDMREPMEMSLAASRQPEVSPTICIFQALHRDRLPAPQLSRQAGKARRVLACIFFVTFVPLV